MLGRLSISAWPDQKVRRDVSDEQWVNSCQPFRPLENRPAGYLNPWDPSWAGEDHRFSQLVLPTRQRRPSA